MIHRNARVPDGFVFFKGQWLALLSFLISCIVAFFIWDQVRVARDTEMRSLRARRPTCGKWDRLCNKLRRTMNCTIGTRNDLWLIQQNAASKKKQSQQQRQK